MRDVTSSSSSSNGGGGGGGGNGGAAINSLPCPTDAMNLEDPLQLDRMLAARANSDGDVIITILGPTSGTRAIVMDQIMGEAFVLNLLRTLASFGVTNTLPITTHLHQKDHPQNNLCLSRLQPAGVCCAYSGVGMDLVHAGKPGVRWTVTETHPYMLFLQRWWLTGQATYRGYNVLSLDTDLHLISNPLAMLKTSAYLTFGAIMQLDSGWPVQGYKEGQAPTDERGQHVNVVPCVHSSSSNGASAAAGMDGAHVKCGCGVAPQPLLNTGFVYVRASKGRVGPSLPQLIYNRSVEKILMRLGGNGQNFDKKGKIDPHAVWAQDVVNEAAAELSSLPVGWEPPTCHKKDTSCRVRPLSAQDAKDAKRRWWLHKASHSVWLASHQLSTGGTCTANGNFNGGASHDKHLVAWTALAHPDGDASLSRRHGGVTNDGRGHALHEEGLERVTTTNKIDTPLPYPPLTSLPPPSSSFTPTLAALPRTAVGRMCGMRVNAHTSWLTRAQPLPCAAGGGSEEVRKLFGQEVLHMQFTNADTRKAILEALHWWKGPPPSAFASATGAAATSAASTQTSCAALASGSAAAGRLSATIVSSALSPSALLCLLPGQREGQSLHLPMPTEVPNQCPCCWKVEDLQKGATAASAAATDAAAAKEEVKALGKARKYQGCKIWRRYA